MAISSATPIHRGRWLIPLLVGMVLGAGSIDALQRAAPEPPTPQPPRRQDQRPFVPALSQRLAALDLKNGGFILYFRHPQREKWDSVIAFDVYELATKVDAAGGSFHDAVCLTPQGREEAKMIGAIFHLAEIPVGNVTSSPSCRARQGAIIAFGRIDDVRRGLAHTPVVNPDNAESFFRALESTLRTIRIEEGKNAVIIAHGNTLENHHDLFASGAEILGPPLLQETGLYVIRRDGTGSLHLVQEFLNLGELAANAIDLAPH